MTENIEKYLKKHEEKGILRFITCGSVDDGKSTLIGRLLHDSKAIFEDQLSSLEKDSKKVGTTGAKLDLALLVDGLQSEREQGITIDVAYRYFSTEAKKYIIADTPGHEQYTRNMATGASTADLAVILIDARLGVLTQTKRHSYIVSLLGIRQIVVAINKMDLVGYQEVVFENIKTAYLEIANLLPEYEKLNIVFMPICALDGDNVVEYSPNMPWYKGETLISHLDNLDLSYDDSRENVGFRLAVQYVNRPNLDFRGFCGTIASGCVLVGDEITVLPSKKHSKIKAIIPPSVASNAQKPITTEKAFAGMAVTVTLEEEIDIGRGDIIVHSDGIPHISDGLSVMLVWMDEEPMELRKNYLIKRATTVASGIFDAIEYKKDIDSFDEVGVPQLKLNDIARCHLSLDREIAFDFYSDNRYTGGFIVIDRHTNNTVGAGMIVGYDDKSGFSGAKNYTQIEKELNLFIRTKYPEWECRAI